MELSLSYKINIINESIKSVNNILEKDTKDINEI